MQDLNGLMGVIYGASEWFLKMAITNFMWFLMGLPLFAAFLAIDISNAAGIILFSALVLLFAPLLFFPATAAVFASARDWLLGNDSSAVKMYIAHLKANYKESVKMGVPFAAVWLFWYLAYFYLGTGSGALNWLFLVTGLALFVYIVNFLSISVHYRMNRKERLLNAFFVSAGSPLLSLVIVAGNGLLIWITAVKLLLLLPLLTASLGVFVSFSAFYSFTLRVKNKQEAKASA
ncbi:YesL family protein [Planococcus sp. FY231025]|uniref:YesL family protein n=1 Tax=Planococcus sp. FY231025 TaxID=3455699 RepID=UPI003F8F1A41